MRASGAVGLFRAMGLVALAMRPAVYCPVELMCSGRNPVKQVHASGPPIAAGDPIMKSPRLSTAGLKPPALLTV